MTKINEIRNKEEVRMIRDSAWKENADIWSKSRNLPILLKDYIYQKICLNIKTQEGVLIDLGCGNAWLVDYLIDMKHQKINYLGLEINNYFVESNIEKYKEQKTINFIKSDLEKSNDFNFQFQNEHKYLIGCLSFIELIDLNTAFSNVSEIMNTDDKLCLIVLDPNFEIFRMSDNMKEIENNLINLLKFEQSYYKKEIILNTDFNFKKEYVGLLHKIEDYISNAYHHRLVIESIDNINCYSQETKKGTIYRVLNFRKVE